MVKIWFSTECQLAATELQASYDISNDQDALKLCSLKQVLFLCPEEDGLLL